MWLSELYAIDTEGLNRLFMTLKDDETVEKALPTDVTSRFQLSQLGHNACIAAGRVVCGELILIKMVGIC